MDVDRILLEYRTGAGWLPDAYETVCARTDALSLEETQPVARDNVQVSAVNETQTPTATRYEQAHLTRGLYQLFGIAGDAERAKYIESGELATTKNLEQQVANASVDSIPEPAAVIVDPSVTQAHPCQSPHHDLRVDCECGLCEVKILDTVRVSFPNAKKIDAIPGAQGMAVDSIAGGQEEPKSMGASTWMLTAATLRARKHAKDKARANLKKAKKAKAKLARERLANATWAKEKAKKAKEAKVRLAKARLAKERLEKQRLEKAKAKKEKKAKAKLAKEKLAKAKLAKEKSMKAKLAKRKTAKAKVAKGKPNKKKGK